MRNSPANSGIDKSERMGLAAVLTGYAALAIILLIFAALLIAGHRHATAPAPHAAEADTFGIEEWVDLFVAEPDIPPFGVAWAKRPIARVEFSPGLRR